MWRVLLFSILVATTQGAFDTPLCPNGGEPVCAKSGFEFIYFENECKLNVFSYKELFAGRPSPTKVPLVECFSNCAGILCPALFQPVCAQQVPGGSLQTVSNACLVNQLICQTRQQWVIIANGACPEPAQIDAVPPPYSPAPVPAPAPVPSYETKAAYEPSNQAPTATYYAPSAPAAPVESAPATNYNAPAPAPACAADYSALAPVLVPSPASYVAPAPDAYTSQSQALPNAPSSYSPPAVPDSYASAGASSYLATGVDPAPFANPPSEYVATPEPMTPPSACQSSYSQESAPKYASIPAVEPYTVPAPAPAPVPAPATYEPAPLPCSVSETAPAPAPSAYQNTYQPAPSVYAVSATPVSSPTAYSVPAPASASVSYESRNQYSVETPSSCSTSSQYAVPSAVPATDSYAAPSPPAESYSDAKLYPAAPVPTPYSAPATPPCSASEQYTQLNSNPYAPSDQNSVSEPDSYSNPSAAQYQAPATDLSLYAAPTSAPSPYANPYSSQYPLSVTVNSPAAMAYGTSPSPACTCTSNPPQSSIRSLKYDIPAIIGAPQEISAEYVPDLAALLSKWIDNNPLISQNGLQSIAPFYYQPTYTLIEYKASKSPGSY